MSEHFEVLRATGADGEPPEKHANGGRRFTWVWAAVGSALITALVVYFVLRPQGEEPVAAPITVVVTATVAAVASSPSPSPSIAEQSPSQSPSASPTPSPSPIAESLTPVASASPSALPSVQPEAPASAEDPSWPELEDGWVSVHEGFSSAEHLGGLAGPRGFREFASNYVGVVDEYGCTTQFWVFAMHPDGYVYGAEEWADCGGGGAQVIWADQGGSWAPVLTTQDMFDCYQLAAVGLPDNTGEIECFADGQTWWY